MAVFLRREKWQPQYIFFSMLPYCWQDELRIWCIFLLEEGSYTILMSYPLVHCSNVNLQKRVNPNFLVLYEKKIWHARVRKKKICLWKKEQTPPSKELRFFSLSLTLYKRGASFFLYSSAVSQIFSLPQKNLWLFEEKNLHFFQCCLIVGKMSLYDAFLLEEDYTILIYPLVHCSNVNSTKASQSTFLEKKCQGRKKKSFEKKSSKELLFSLSLSVVGAILLTALSAFAV